MKPFREDRVRWAGRGVLVTVLAGSLGAAQEAAGQAALPPPAATQPAAPQPEAARAPAAGVVTANILVVRARPAAHYERVGQFARGDTLHIVGGNADWYEVNVPPDTRAWIAAQYLSPEGLVTADQVHLHSGPGLVFTTFASAKQGTKLEILGPPVDGWQQVRAPGTATAWVSRAYVRVEEPEPPAAPPASPAVKAAEPADGKALTPAPAAAETGATVSAAAKVEPATPPPAAEARVEPPPTPAEAHAEPATPPPAAEARVEPPPTPAEAHAEPAPPPPAAEAKVEPPPTPAETGPVVQAPAETKAETPTPANATPEPAATVEPPAAPVAATTTPALPEATATPAVPPGTPTAPAPDAPMLMKAGLLLSLKSQASEFASHVLCMRVGHTAYPLCYLKSLRVDLTEWENRSVLVYGPELRIPGWALPVLHVQSIQVKLD